MIADWFIIEDKLQVFSGHTLNIYNINKDPRTIKHLINGVSSNHLKSLIGIHPLKNNLYITVNIDTV